MKSRRIKIETRSIGFAFTRGGFVGDALRKPDRFGHESQAIFYDSRPTPVIAVKLSGASVTRTEPQVHHQTGAARSSEQKGFLTKGAQSIHRALFLTKMPQSRIVTIWIAAVTITVIVSGLIGGIISNYQDRRFVLSTSDYVEDALWLADGLTIQ